MIRGIRWTCAMVLLGPIVAMTNVGPSEAVSGVQAPPIRLADGTSAYGCTEFIFRLGPEAVAGADAARIGRAIERWLPFGA